MIMIPILGETRCSEMGWKAKGDFAARKNPSSPGEPLTESPEPRHKTRRSLSLLLQCNLGTAQHSVLDSSKTEDIHVQPLRGT
jgi:hypothetical protein